jgi:flagella basal body P-ring formation protein FlgA
MINFNLVIKISCLFFTLLFFKDAYSSYLKNNNVCTINSYSKIYFQQEISKKNLSRLIKKSNCSKKINIEFLNLMRKSHGIFSTNHLQRIYFPQSKNFKVTIRPKKIHLRSLNHLISNKINAHNHHFPTNTTFRGKKRLILLTKNQNIELICSKCETLGRKNIILNITDNQLKRSEKVWIKTTIKTKVKAFVSNINFNYPFGNKISAEQFKEKDIETDSPENIFSNIDKIHFFKLTHPIKKNHPLRIQDLTPKRLVRAFSPVKIFLKSKNIQLSGMAIAKTSGHFGEVIILENKKNRRTLIGKVVGLNKVEIEL